MDFSSAGFTPMDSQWLQTTAFSFQVLFSSSQLLADSCSYLAAGRMSEASLLQVVSVEDELEKGEIF